MPPRLNASSKLPDTVAMPAYTPAKHGEGILHLGLGAFHRAHQAVYTDDALALAGGDWRILGVSLRSAAPAEELAPQDGLYTLIIRGEGEPRVRVIGSISRALCGKTDIDEIRRALADPSIRIVSLTVTEKGYGIDRAAGGADPDHPAVAADLASPDAPTGVLGLIVQALKARRAAGTPPFTVLSCDNLPENGVMLRGGVVDFARRLDPELADWIESAVAFPSCMVDRITPARTDATIADAERLTGHSDAAVIETEPFTQWVVEENFPAGRPAWDKAGALFVKDVAPYEKMKLRMLNGAHSMLAYSGFLAGQRYVRDAMADPDLRTLIERHLSAAAATLDPLPGIDFGEYAQDLSARFANPSIAHETYQIAMDGTQKLPQRVLGPALAALQAGQPVRPFAFATAAWMRYCLGRKDDGETYALRDPLEAEIAARIGTADTAEAIFTSLAALRGVFPEALMAAPEWRGEVVGALAGMLESGVPAAIHTEAASVRA
ncbi:mannitol dehydrogenase family protein [Tropicimonas sp. IMCC6043]|uniref:mannitol dehydrogenase family protein n=1 Tax=Tropicimonas sp. IMCC6043 TaxID=2510645 RepID=UPI00101BC45C|nr:mannitol dehydrogenase family protein [Tropicimonas sp. IMCC6043]RYH09229.1 mannitol dehydrogenase family protein [Tropicimonas sp. IMCC6043]